MHSRGADRFGQKTVAVIAVAVLPTARHGNARDVVIAVVSIARDAPIDVGDLCDVAVRIVFVFRLKRFLEHLCVGIVLTPHISYSLILASVRTNPVSL